jgi:hypothetical protein
LSRGWRRVLGFASHVFYALLSSTLPCPDSLLCRTGAFGLGIHYHPREIEGNEAH